MNETPPTVTIEQIQDLEREAMIFGDDGQVAMCRLALRGDADAWIACSWAIAEQEKKHAD